MKKLLGIALACLFSLVLLALLIYKLFFFHPKVFKETPTYNAFTDVTVTSVPITNDTPYRTTISCYSWYLKVHLSPATLDEIAAQPQASSCFTPSFIAQWDTTLRNTEADPVLTVADYGPTWQSSIISQQLSQSIHTNDQRLTLGTGDDSFVVLVHLIQTEDGLWEIDSVRR